MTDILNALNWRYATKEYDKTKKISDHDFDEILEAMRLSPSSFGIQPWRFIVVKTPELRQELQKVAYGQSPITDASHIIVLAAKNNLTLHNVDEYIHSIAETRGIPLDSLDGFKQYIVGSMQGKSQEQLKIWNQKQVYIALGIGLETAALKGIDATPMEGFDPAGVDKVLGLEKEGYASTVLLALGYRSVNDKAAHYKKARFAKKQITEFR